MLTTHLVVFIYWECLSVCLCYTVGVSYWRLEFGHVSLMHTVMSVQFIWAGEFLLTAVPATDKGLLTWSWTEQTWQHVKVLTFKRNSFMCIKKMFEEFETKKRFTHLFYLYESVCVFWDDPSGKTFFRMSGTERVWHLQHHHHRGQMTHSHDHSGLGKLYGCFMMKTLK